MVFDLYSKRARVARGDVLEVYSYDELPKQLRVQITYLFDKSFKLSHLANVREDAYKAITDILREERGVYQLADGEVGDMSFDGYWDYEKEIKDYFLKEKIVEYALDVVEMFFIGVQNFLNNQGDNGSEIATIINNLNTRFKEHGVGYAYEGGKLIRIDSEMIHNTIVKPTLQLLHNKQFKNAENEYLSAHEHYRNGKYEECFVDCLKAIESTIKIIGHKRGWSINDKDTASKLIEHVLNKKLIPDYLQTHFNALRSCLESGVPTVRNKSGGHGKGVRTDVVPAYMAEYLLGSSATTIRFLVEADKAQPQATDNTK